MAGPQTTGGDTPELEELGDNWQVARQEVRSLPAACDVQSQEHDLCNGWDDFTDDDLATFYRELNGRAVTIIPVGRPTSACGVKPAA